MPERHQPVAICDQFVFLVECQLEHEPIGKPVPVATDLFLQPAGRDAVDFGKVDVQHDTFTAYLQNRIGYSFGRDEVS